MSAALPLPRSALDAVAMPRRVSILGATGSIGASTIQILKQQPSSYGIEAVTAGSNAVALAIAARELGARFAAVADPNAYRELKAALAGTAIEAAAGPDAMIEAA